MASGWAAIRGPGGEVHHQGQLQICGAGAPSRSSPSAGREGSSMPGGGPSVLPTGSAARHFHSCIQRGVFRGRSVRGKETVLGTTIPRTQEVSTNSDVPHSLEDSWRNETLGRASWTRFWTRSQPRTTFSYVPEGTASQGLCRDCVPAGHSRIVCKDLTRGGVAGP